MTAWTADELDRIGHATEVAVASRSRRADDILSPYATIWGVRSGGGVCIRSAYRPGNGWYRRAKARRAGRLRAGEVVRERGVLHRVTDKQSTWTTLGSPLFLSDSPTAEPARATYSERTPNQSSGTTCAYPMRISPSSATRA